MAKRIYTEDLNRMICSNPKCCEDHKEGLVLNPACHVGAPLVATYRKGILELKCSICEKEIADVVIASKTTLN